MGSLHIGHSTCEEDTRMIVALCAEFFVCEIGKGEKVKQQSKMDVEAAKLTMYRSMKTQI